MRVGVRDSGRESHFIIIIFKGIVKCKHIIRSIRFPINLAIFKTRTFLSMLPLSLIITHVSNFTESNGSETLLIKEAVSGEVDYAEGYSVILPRVVCLEVESMNMSVCIGIGS